MDAELLHFGSDAASDSGITSGNAAAEFVYLRYWSVADYMRNLSDLSSK